MKYFCACTLFEKKGSRVLRERNSVKYAWIKKHSKSFSIQLMCKLFCLTRSSYYHWIDNGCMKERVDKPFNNLLKKIFEESRATYGTRRLKAILEKRYGLIVSRRKIQNSLTQMNLKVKMKRRYKIITITSNHKLPISPNLLEKYEIIQSMSKKGDCWVLVLALSLRMQLQRAFFTL